MRDMGREEEGARARGADWSGSEAKCACKRRTKTSSDSGAEGEADEKAAMAED